jgi:hypothetical protein
MYGGDDDNNNNNNKKISKAAIRMNKQDMLPPVFVTPTAVAHPPERVLRYIPQTLPVKYIFCSYRVFQFLTI